jgi:pyruvate kinase
MESTNTIPNVPLNEFKKTKILATIGPVTNSYESILALIKAGANGIRLNFSHGNHEERVEQIKWIRKASKAAGKPVAILQDLQGPKIRLGDFEGVYTVSAGQEIRIKYNADFERSGILPVQYDLSKKLKRGERVYMYDGKIRTVVTSIKDGVVYLRADNDGILIKRKGINIPDTDLSGDVLTKKDLIDLAFGATQDIDYVAISFVQTAADVELLRKHMRNHNFNAKIIAKLETKAAMDNLCEIIDASDSIMVARGDLAPEVSFEAVPVFQERIIRESIKRSKPVIVATQVLASMTDAPEPTRAEASDVAMATFMGADVIMLSDETANGRYPVQSVEVMKRIIKHTEANYDFGNKIAVHKDDHSKQSSIAKAVVTLADQIKADVIVSETRSGATARQIAALRPEVPQVSVTSDSRVAQQLALVYGIKSFVRPDGATQTQKLTAWLRTHDILKQGNTIVCASGQYPGVIGCTDTIKVRVLE